MQNKLTNIQEFRKKRTNIYLYWLTDRLKDQINQKLDAQCFTKILGIYVEKHPKDS